MSTRPAAVDAIAPLSDNFPAQSWRLTQESLEEVCERWAEVQSETEWKGVDRLKNEEEN